MDDQSWRVFVKLAKLWKDNWKSNNNYPQGKILSKKLIRKNNIKYYLFLTGVLLFMFVGCSSSNLEKIKEKTKDIKKEDLEELKEKVKKIKK